MRKGFIFLGVLAALCVAVWLLLTTHFVTEKIPSADGKYVCVVKNTPLGEIPLFDPDYVIEVHDASWKMLPGEPFRLNYGPVIGRVEWSGSNIAVHGISDGGWLGHVRNGRQEWEKP